MGVNNIWWDWYDFEIMGILLRNGAETENFVDEWVRYKSNVTKVGPSGFTAHAVMSVRIFPAGVPGTFFSWVILNTFFCSERVMNVLM